LNTLKSLTSPDIQRHGRTMIVIGILRSIGSLSDEKIERSLKILPGKPNKCFLIRKSKRSQIRSWAPGSS